MSKIEEGSGGEMHDQEPVQTGYEVKRLSEISEPEIAEVLNRKYMPNEAPLNGGHIVLPDSLFLHLNRPFSGTDVGEFDIIVPRIIRDVGEIQIDAVFFYAGVVKGLDSITFVKAPRRAVDSRRRPIRSEPLERLVGITLTRSGGFQNFSIQREELDVNDAFHKALLEAEILGDEQIAIEMEAQERIEKQRKQDMERLEKAARQLYPFNS